MLVCLVWLVCLVYLVCLVCLVYLVDVAQLAELRKRADGRTGMECNPAVRLVAIAYRQVPVSTMRSAERL